MKVVIFNGMDIIGQSPKIQEVLRTADLVAGTDVPVLISGETGTGKDLFARRIHQQSVRHAQAFVKVSSASMDDGFSMSLKRARFGTLFLDQVDSLPDDLQQRLLHFIESSEVVRGDGRRVNYDVRIIASSQQNLHQAVEAGRFRSDLFYRLNVIPLELPALRQREGDSIILMDYFFRELVRKQHLTPPGFTAAALRQINKYQWPGNVRELRNFCERLLILFAGREIDVANLPHEMRYVSGSSAENPNAAFNLPENGIKLESVEVSLMLQALDKSSGNKSKAARLLGLSRDTFLYRLKKYAIET